MLKKSKIPGLIEMVSSVLEKSRDTLSEEEVQAMEETINVLKELEEAGPSEFRKKGEFIAVNLLKLFTNPEIMKQLLEWFNN